MSLYAELIAMIEKVVKETKHKADLPVAIVDTLFDSDLTRLIEDVTIFVADPTLSATHEIETPEGVRIEYRQDAAISYRFPAGVIWEIES